MNLTTEDEEVLIQKIADLTSELYSIRAREKEILKTRDGLTITLGVVRAANNQISKEASRGDLADFDPMGGKK